MRQPQCLPPNSIDITVIQKFLNSVSWASECILCQLVDRDRVWVKVPDLYVLVPTSCEEFPDNLKEVELAASTLKMTPGVIFYGDPSDYHRDEMNHIARQQEMVVYWTGAKNQVRYSRWLREATDGIPLLKLLCEEPPQSDGGASLRL